MLFADFLQASITVCISGIAFVLLSAIIFFPLEEVFHCEPKTEIKLKDIVYFWFYQSYGLWIAAGFIYFFAFYLRQILPAGLTGFVSHYPLWVQSILALLLAELWVYIFHRLSHSWSFLWRFHKVHHTVVKMNWSASSRQHPLDFFLMVVGANLPAMVLGIDLQSIALFIILERVYVVLLHSNVNFDWGWFSKIVASPRLHRTHHAHGRRGKNYAGILSLLDVIGNSYQKPKALESELSQGIKINSK